MVRNCCVHKCSNRSGKSSSLTFHCFPKDHTQLQKWLKAVSRETLDGKPWTPTKNDRVCSEHFLQDDFENTDQSKGYKNKRLKSTAVPKVFKDHPPYKQHQTRRTHSTDQLNVTEEKDVLTEVFEEDIVNISPANCNEIKSELPFETPQSVTSGVKKTAGSKGTCNMLEGNTCFGKLTEDKLRHLIELLLKVTRIDVDLLDDCLHGGRKIVDAWKEVDKLRFLIEALRKDLKPELDVYHSPPTPPCFVGRPEPQPHQLPQYDDDNDDAGESEDVASTGDTEVDDEAGAISSRLQIQPDIQKISPGPKTEASTTRPQTSKTAAEYPHVRLQNNFEVRNLREIGERKYASVIKERVLGQEKGTAVSKKTETGHFQGQEKETAVSEKTETEIVPGQSHGQEKWTAVIEETETDQSQGYHCVCDKCGAKFKDIACRNAHYEIHKELVAHQNYICKFCGKQEHPSTLKAHIDLAHNHSCVVCMKTFRYAVGLKTHEEKYPGGTCVSLKGLISLNGRKEKGAADSQKRLKRLSQREEKRAADSQKRLQKKKKGAADSQKRLKRLSQRKEKAAADREETHGPYFCDICGKVLKNKESFRVHYRRQHKDQDPNETLMCNFCGKEFKVLRNYRIHLRKYAQRVSCRFCKQTFSNIAVFRKHEEKYRKGLCFRKDKVKAGSQGQVKEPDISIKKVKDQSESLVRKIPKPSICDRCGVTFKTRGGLRAHIHRHEALDENQTHCCHICGKGFKLMCALKRHLKTHTNTVTKRSLTKRKACHVCNKIFNAANIIRHMRVHTGERPWKCTYTDCGKAFIQHDEFKRHIRRHTGERPWKCNQCDKSFMQKFTYTKHMRLHTGEKPWKCSLCDQSFAIRSNYTKHLMSHCGQQNNCNFTDQPHECSLCAKVFKSKESLRAHVNIHIGVFTCQMCNKTFSFLANLKRHMLEVHSKVRSFKCEVCGRSFAQKVTLDLHLWTHRTDKRFTCEVCGHGTNDRRNFRNHGKKTGHSTPALMVSRGTNQSTPALTISQGQQSTQTTAYTNSQAPDLYVGDNPSVLGNGIGHYSYGNGQGSSHAQIQQNSNSNSNPSLSTDMLYTVVVSPQQELF